MPDIVLDPFSRSVCVVGCNNEIAGITTVQQQDHFQSRFENLGAMATMVSNVGRRFGTHRPSNQQVIEEQQHRNAMQVGYACVVQICFIAFIVRENNYLLSMFL
jgi:hypothetical protein